MPVATIRTQAGEHPCAKRRGYRTLPRESARPTFGLARVPAQPMQAPLLAPSAPNPGPKQDYR